jgi:hypothetical protein
MPASAARCALRAPDPGELGVRLAAAPTVDRAATDRQLDPRRVDAVGHGDGQVGRHQRGLHAPLAQRADEDLELCLVTRRARVDEVVEPEVVEELDVRVRPRLGDPRLLERARQHERLAVAIDEQERIDDHQRHLVAHRGMPRRVAVRQDRGPRAQALRDRGRRRWR